MAGEFERLGISAARGADDTSRFWCQDGVILEGPTMTETLLPTTVVGGYPQPDWLIDRDKLTHLPPMRVRASELWRGAEALARSRPRRRNADRDPRHRARRDRHHHRRRDPSRELLEPLRDRTLGCRSRQPRDRARRTSGTVVVPRI